jgi:hypothetical protein
VRPCGLPQIAPRHDLIGSSLAGVAWKDFMPRVNISPTSMIGMTMHATMLEILVTAVHVVPIMIMAIALHVVVTAMAPSHTATASMCFGHGCSADGQNRCSQDRQQLTRFHHCTPSQVKTG